MSTASTFTQKLTINDIHQPVKSVGAHLAAKLELFCTDERTLTDELCDMLCIWLGMQFNPSYAAIVGPSFDLTISKTTTAEEVKTGADLELIVQSPLGSKRCLIQAKVLDPGTNKLRCASKQGWNKLRKQLVDARNEVGDLAFLLIYIPMKHLNGNSYGYATYEQAGIFTVKGSLPASYGATLIPVDKLIGSSGRWRNRKEKVPRSSSGGFKNGISFWRVLLELMLCRRSEWSTDHKHIDAQEISPFRTLGFRASEISKDSWEELQLMADQFLESSDS